MLQGSKHGCRIQITKSAPFAAGARDLGQGSAGCRFSHSLSRPILRSASSLGQGIRCQLPNAKTAAANVFHPSHSSYPERRFAPAIPARVHILLQLAVEKEKSRVSPPVLWHLLVNPNTTNKQTNRTEIIGLEANSRPAGSYPIEAPKRVDILGEQSSSRFLANHQPQCHPLYRCIL